MQNENHSTKDARMERRQEAMLKKPGLEKQVGQNLTYLASGTCWDVFKPQDPDQAKGLKDRVVKLWRSQNKFLPPQYKPEKYKNGENGVLQRLFAEHKFLEDQYTKNPALAKLLPLEQLQLTTSPKDKKDIMAIEEEFNEEYTWGLDALLKEWRQNPIPSKNELLELSAEEQEEWQTEKEERNKIRAQLSGLVSITKKLVNDTHAKSPEFNHAIPDLSDPGNVKIDYSGDEPIVKLVDTSGILPVDDPVSRNNSILRNSVFFLSMIETRFLGRNFDNLDQDEFYTKNGFKPVRDEIKNAYDISKKLLTTDPKSPEAKVTATQFMQYMRRHTGVQ